MPFNPLTHFVLVDFENRPDIDLAPLDGHPVTVTLFLGQKSKLKAGLVTQISTLPFEVRLIKVGMTGKNALDFVLTFHLGEMVARSPRAHYHIISGDKDFEPLVTHLGSNHFHVTQHNEIAGLPFLVPKKKATAAPFPPSAKVTASTKSKAPFMLDPVMVLPTDKIAPVKAAPTKKKPTDKRANVIARMKNPSAHNRPSTRKALLAHVKNGLGVGASDSEAQELLRELERQQVLTIALGGKILYANVK